MSVIESLPEPGRSIVLTEIRRRGFSELSDTDLLEKLAQNFLLIHLWRMGLGRGGIADNVKKLSIAQPLLSLNLTPEELTNGLNQIRNLLQEAGIVRPWLRESETGQYTGPSGFHKDLSAN